RVVRDPIDLIDKIMNDGHQVALHGYTHQNYDLMTYDAIHEDLTKTSDLIHTFGKVRPAFVRVPYDKCSTANCTKVLSDMGLTRIHYNVDSSDWENAYRNDTPSQQDKVLRPEDESTKLSMERLNGILKEADPKHDSIILLHHETFPFVLKLIPKVIDTIRAKGFTFVPLAECLGEMPYKECQFTSSHPYHRKTHHDSTTTTTNSTPSHTPTPTPIPTGGAQVHNVAAWTFGLGAILAYVLA
ncbi:chitin deacetylase, partial [Mortierella alpina]